MCFRSCSVAMLFSILRATSFSSCAGEAPGSATVTEIVGRSMSGKFCTFMALNDSRPPKVSSTNSISAGMGFLIDQVDTFMSNAPQLIAACALLVSARAIFLLKSGACEVLLAGGVLTTRTRSPSFRKPAPRTATEAFASRPESTSTRSATRRPVCTLRICTRCSAPTTNTYEKPSRTTSASCGTVSASLAPSANSPRANMPARKSVFRGRSTYTSALRVCGSTVGAIMRTVPSAVAPLAAVTLTLAPSAMRRSSVDVTSARHSRRPLRTMRNSSVPAPTTAPTVAVRAEITPLSGATTWVYFRRNCCAFSVALAASTRACAVFSAVVYCWICCWLKAPVACSEQAAADLGHIGLCGFGRESCQHLAGLDHVAYVHTHVGQAQAVAFGANAGLLPGGNVAIGRQAQRHRGALGLGRAHGKRGAGLARLGLIGGARCVGEHQGATGGQCAGSDDGEGRGRNLETLRLHCVYPFIQSVSGERVSDQPPPPVFHSACGGSRSRRGGCRGGGLPVPSTASGAVQRNPGGLAFMLQRDQRVLGRQGRAPRVFQLHQTRQAAAPARFGGIKRCAIARSRSSRAGAALGRALQPHQRLFDLAHGLAHLGAVERRGFVIARLRRVHLRAAPATIEQRHAERQRADGPGVQVGGHATAAHPRRAHRAAERQARVTLGLGAAHFGTGSGDFALGVVHIRALGQHLGG